MQTPKTPKAKLTALATDGTKDFSDYLHQSVEDLPVKKRQIEFGLLLLQTLAAKGHTQASLAEQLGISRQQVNSIIKGKENITFATMQKLEDALGVQLQHFYALELPKDTKSSLKIPIQNLVVYVRDTLFPGEISFGKTLHVPITQKGTAANTKSGYSILALAVSSASTNC